MLGLSAASITASFAGPAALVFVIGYNLCLRSAGKALGQFPSLMRLYLQANCPLKPWEQMQVHRESANGSYRVVRWRRYRCFGFFFPYGRGDDSGDWAIERREGADADIG